MTENEIAARVPDAAFKVHRTLGPGLLESVYHTVLVYVLRKNGLAVRAPAPIDIVYDDLRFTGAFAADLIVEDKVVVELKSVEKTAPVHKKQTLTYVRLADKRLGLLLNFGAAMLKDGITRVANGLDDTPPHVAALRRSERLLPNPDRNSAGLH
jgi:GxxExxY protein